MNLRFEHLGAARRGPSSDKASWPMEDNLRGTLRQLRRILRTLCVTCSCRGPSKQDFGWGIIVGGGSIKGPKRVALVFGMLPYGIPERLV